MQTKITTKRTLLTSFVVDLIDVVMNTLVTILTGSMVMLAEMLQGIADVIMDIMLMFGYVRSKKRSSKRHPFGYGKELYFWAIMAAVIIFFVTASLAVYFGVRQIITPEAIENLMLAYAVLSVGTLTNAYAFSVSFRRLQGIRNGRGLWRTFIESSHAIPKTTFVADLMGTLASLIGLLALIAYGITGNAQLDGLGAAAIGVMLAALALVLLIGLKTLVTGRSGSPQDEQQIRRIARAHPAVRAILDLKTMVIGPDKLLINLEVHLQDDLTTDEIERIIDEIKAAIKKALPQAHHIQVELETPSDEL